MPKTRHPPASIKVAVIAFDGITPFHLSVPCLVFGSGPRKPELPAFEVTVCAPGKAPLRTSAGFSIATECELSDAESADVVVMPSWYDDCRNAPASLLDTLRRAHKRGARIVGLCLGAFPLAEAGLLDGRSATTHWAHTAELAMRFPTVRVDAEVLYIDEGEVLTSAGVAAGLDCCLHVLRQFAGADAANKVARRLLIAPHRQGGQAQFIERPVPASSTEGRFSQALEWVTRHLEQEHSIDALAERTAMSRRNFTRHFRQATGTSFKQWLLNQRLAYAQRMLETSDASVEAVAQKAGFGTGLSLRQHFRATLRTSPTDYRKQFRTDASALQKAE